MRHPTRRRPSASAAGKARRRTKREVRWRRRRESDACATWSTRGRARASPQTTLSHAVGCAARCATWFSGAELPNARTRRVSAERCAALALPASNPGACLIALTGDRPVKRLDSESGDFNRKQTSLFRLRCPPSMPPSSFRPQRNFFPRAATDPWLTALESHRLFRSVAAATSTDARRRGCR